MVGYLTAFNKLSHWLLDQAQEAVLVVHGEELVFILRPHRHVCNLANYLVCSLELIDARDELVLGHGVLVHVEVVLAAHDHVQGRPPDVLDDQVFAIVLLGNDSCQIDKPVRHALLNLLGLALLSSLLLALLHLLKFVLLVSLLLRVALVFVKLPLALATLVLILFLFTAAAIIRRLFTLLLCCLLSSTLLLVFLVSSASLALLLFFLWLLVLSSLLLALSSFARSWAVSTGPELSSFSGERAVFVPDEDALNDHRLFGLDRVKEVLAGLVSGDVLGQWDLLWVLECNRGQCLTQLSNLVVTPAVDGGVLETGRAHLVNLAL